MDPIGSHENSITNLIFLTWAYKELQLSLIMNNEITKHSAPEAVPRLQKSSESFVSREIIPSIIKKTHPRQSIFHAYYPPSEVGHTSQARRPELVSQRHIHHETPHIRLPLGYYLTSIRWMSIVTDVSFVGRMQSLLHQQVLRHGVLEFKVQADYNGCSDRRQDDEFVADGGLLAVADDRVATHRLHVRPDLRADLSPPDVTSLRLI